jgi:hypothetical protein
VIALAGRATAALSSSHIRCNQPLTRTDLLDSRGKAPLRWERCLAEFGWEEKRALQGREIDGHYHGVAVACFIGGGGAGPKETAPLVRWSSKRVSRKNGGATRTQ